jgi:hypothetical protein
LFGNLKLSKERATKIWEKYPFMRKYFYKKFRGMSTKEVQKKWGKQHLTTSEGVVRYRQVEYSLDKWLENFEAYLRSAMSYTNSKNLSEFIGIVETIKISDNSYNRFKK